MNAINTSSKLGLVKATTKTTADRNHIEGCLETETVFTITIGDALSGSIKAYNLDTDHLSTCANKIELGFPAMGHAWMNIKMNKGVYFTDDRDVHMPIAVGIRPWGQIVAIFKWHNRLYWFDLDEIKGDEMPETAGYKPSNNEVWYDVEGDLEKSLAETLRKCNSNRAGGWSFQVIGYRMI